MKNIIFAIVFSLIFVFGCVGLNDTDTTKTQSTNEQGVVALVSIPPQKEFVRNVAGENVEIILLVPPGASPHTYEPTPAQLAKISEAKVYFIVGSNIEVEKIWLDKIQKINPKMQIVNTSENIKMIDMQEHIHEHEEDIATNEQNEHREFDHEQDYQIKQIETKLEPEDEHHTQAKDPHTWTSIKNVKLMVNQIKNYMQNYDEKNSGIYEKNTQEYTKKLDELDVNLTKLLSTNQKQTFFVHHPAWGYFANDYGLEQVAIETLGKEPTPVQLAQIIQQAKERYVKIIFASPQFSTESATTIAQQIDGQIVLIDPLDENYLQNTQNIAQKISIAINGSENETS
jgi:zinc transport system substrate-binding protein